MNSDDSLLGNNTVYPTAYTPNILYPIARNDARKSLGIANSLPFNGVDLWTAYELSWLDLNGKPQSRIGQLTIGCDSVNLVESKSLKLYLNSLNNEKFASEQAVKSVLAKDIESCVKGDVKFSLWNIDNYPVPQKQFTGTCIDDLDISCDSLLPDARLLTVTDGETSEQLYSHLLKTNCPVTGQPDWASIWISYQGVRLSQTGLLQYLVSYRQHQDFHENCVERIMLDILEQCRPTRLEVYARYTRRGGLDINPYRCYGCEPQVPDIRLVRQ